MSSIGSSIGTDRLRNSPGQGTRLLWPTAGAVAGGSTLAVITLVRVLSNWPHHLWVGVAVATTVGLFGAIGAHLSASRAGAEQRVAQLSGIAGGVVGVISIFLVTVVGLGRIPDDDEQGIVILALIAATIGGLAFEPLRKGTTARIADALRADNDNPTEVLELFGRRLRRDLPLDEVLLQVAETLRRSMRVDTTEVWTKVPGALQCRVAIPDRKRAPVPVDDASATSAARASVVGPTWLRVWMPDLLPGRGSSIRVVPLGFAGELLGLILAERPDEDFTPAEEEILTELARHLGLMLHNAQLDHALQETLDRVRLQASELEASRRRLVTASDEERQRIERNLHDGAQQHLVALSVGLNLAKGIICDDPDAATTMVGELQQAVQETIEEIRALAHGIYPPLLRDSGLAAALRAAAARSPLDVTVDGGEVGRAPADVEAAVYFCCLEALQNASKHAPEAAVSISIGVREGGLVFEVVDDGPGFDPEAVSLSAGFTNMSDRVGAAGGHVDWTTAPGDGVRVRGAIPSPSEFARSAGANSDGHEPVFIAAVPERAQRVR